MNPLDNVYVRMAAYILGPLISSTPGMTYTSDPWMIQIDLAVAWPYMTAAFAGITGIFAKWGKR